jgi:hypothetical protein
MGTRMDLQPNPRNTTARKWPSARRKDLLVTCFALVTPKKRVLSHEDSDGGLLALML